MTSFDRTTVGIIISLKRNTESNQISNFFNSPSPNNNENKDYEKFSTAWNT